MNKPASARRPTITMETQRQRQKALARWDGEGGAGPNGPQEGRPTGAGVNKTPLSQETPNAVTPNPQG